MIGMRLWLLAVVGLSVAACSAEEPATATPAAPAPELKSAQQAATAMAPPPTATGSAEDRYTAQRARLVETGVIGWGVEDEAVIEVMGRVPRHEFVPAEHRDQAYDNHPLPIGYGQTISQPYIVALMTQAAGVGPGDTVLEVGTGSGYQAAVLAELADRVYSLEIIAPLATRAADTLARLEYDNVTTRFGDGYFGWEEHAPFDAIVVTAAPDHIPQPLVQQLKIGGRMVIPVGPVGGFQTLWLLTRRGEEEVETVDLGGVRFVPLTRDLTFGE